MFNFAVFSVAIILISSPVFGQGEQNLCICTNNYQPLCGSNGVTYPNQCQFTCAQDQQPSLSIFSDGPCPSKNDDEILVEPEFEEQEPQQACLCSMEFRPVCGSDGKTYGNPCELSCAIVSDPSLTLSSYGECKQPAAAVDPPKPVSPKRSAPEPCFCTREFRPVCGSNGKTYPNKCELTCAQKTIQGLQLVSQGPCEIQA